MVGSSEIVALLGRTGAGKSTAMNLIMGNLKASSGTVRVAGFDPYEEFDRLRGKLAVSFQTDRLLPWRTAVENIELGPADSPRRQGRRPPARDANGSAASRWPARTTSIRTNSQAACASACRSPARSRSIRKSCCSMNRSASSIMSRRKRCARDVSDLVRTLGKTCLLITHRIDDALEMADRILVLASPARVILEVKPTAAERARRRRSRRCTTRSRPPWAKTRQPLTDRKDYNGADHAARCRQRVADQNRTPEPAWANCSAASGSRLCSPRSCPSPTLRRLRVRIMGEHLLAFRDTQGPHRPDRAAMRASRRQPVLGPQRTGRHPLRVPRLEVRRWRHTAWKCRQSRKDKAYEKQRADLKLKSYPTREAGGFVWTYMGPPKLMPELPQFEFMTLPPAHTFRLQEAAAM